LSESTTSNLDDWAVRLTRNLVALIDAKQRAFFFADEISNELPEAAVRHLRAVLHRGWTLRERPEKVALETAMYAVVGGYWHQSHRRQTFDAALAEGDKLVSLMVGSDFLYDFFLEEAPLPIPAYRGDRVPTLGERKSIALRKDRKNIALALRDPSPKVIERLLKNPRVTENDVVLIAASRPASREVLTVVGLCPKWRVSPRVAFALIMNPYTKPTVSLSLLHNISRSDAAEVATASHLARPVQEALELLRKP
jgi:hypothetical protein